MFRFQIRDLLWLTLVVSVALAIYFVKPRPLSPRATWEYRTQYNVWRDSELNRLAEDGWELMDIDHADGTNRRFYFKRQKQHRVIAHDPALPVNQR